jgi:hypothetical protein
MSQYVEDKSTRLKRYDSWRTSSSRALLARRRFLSELRGRKCKMDDAIVRMCSRAISLLGGWVAMTGSVYVIDFDLVFCRRRKERRSLIYIA